MNRFVNISKQALGILLGGFLFACVSVTAFADGKVTVTAESVFVRATASTSAAIVGGALNGESYDVISSENDSSGYTWYKIKLSDGTEGYVRGDLVSTSGVTTESTTTTTTAETGSSETSTLVEVEPIGAYVTGDVNVRAGASTSDTIVTQAKTNTAVSVVAYEKAGDGKTWYSVSFSDSTGASVSGFIREDFIRLDGELVEKTEEPETVEEVTETVEEEPEETVVYNDYEAVYSVDDDTWYLNNYIAGTRTKITDLYSAADLYNTAVDEYEGKLKTKNIILGILIAVIIALIGLGVYAYISVRRWYYGTDEDTEEPVKETKPAKETKTQTHKTEKAEPVRTHTTSQVRMQTVGAESSKTAEKPTVKSNVLTGVRLPDGSIRMPDGSIRKARVGVKLPDGSIKFEDGSVRKPDGTIVKPETHTAELPKVKRTGVSEATVREVKYTHTSEVDSDDDMEYGFLDLDKNTDK